MSVNNSVCPDCMTLVGGDVLRCEKCFEAELKATSAVDPVVKDASCCGSAGSSESVVYLLGQLLSVNQKVLAVLEKAASTEIDEVAEGLGEDREVEQEKSELVVYDVPVVEWRCDVCLECFEEPLMLKGVRVCPACKKTHIHVCRAEDIILSKNKLKDPVVKSLKSQGYVHYKKPVDVFVKYVNASGEGGV